MNANVFKECDAVIENEKVVARRRFVSDSTAAIEIQLQPGGEIPEHDTPEAVFFYILEGSGILTVDGERSEVTRGMVADCLSGIKKSLFNNSDELLSVLVVKMQK